MIYISSACVKFKRIEDSVEYLHQQGFNNIELSGGTEYYDHDQLINNLKKLKYRLGLNYIIHNYFPPPKNPFILNLASLDKEVSKQSFEHLRNCINYSVELGSDKLGFHAGFFFDIPLKQMGKKITAKIYDDWNLANDRFITNFNNLQLYAKEMGVKLYVENNVYSLPNKNTYGDKSPLMLIDVEDYEKMSKEIDFNLLLDLAHLKVSCNSMNKSFDKNLNTLYDKTDYIHLSDNNGEVDSNKVIKEDSVIYKFLKERTIKDKTVTIEVYEDIDKIKRLYTSLKSI